MNFVFLSPHFPPNYYMFCVHLHQLGVNVLGLANDIDIYKEWANVVVHNKFIASYSREYHCCYIGRKFNKQYKHSHEQIINTFKEQLVHHENISGVFSAALGDYGYLFRTRSYEEILKMADFTHKLI